MSSKRPLIEQFNGKNAIDIERWFRQYDIAMARLEITVEAVKVAELQSYLAGDAFNFYAAKVVDISSTRYNDLKASFISRFGVKTIAPNIAAHRRRLERNESIKTYFDAKIDLLERTGLSEEHVVAEIIEGLPDNYKSLLIATSIVKTDTLLETLIRIEANLPSVSRTAQPQKPVTTSHSNCTISHCDSTTADTASTTEDDESTPSTSQQTIPKAVTNQSNRSQTSNTTNSNYKSRPDNSAPQCLYCKDKGIVAYHWHRECSHNPKNAPQPDTASTTESQNMCALSSTTGHKAVVPTDNFVTVPAFINKDKTAVVLDTGSIPNLMSLKYAKTLKLQLNNSDTIEVTTAGGRPRRYFAAIVNLKIFDKLHRIRVAVLPHFSYNLLIGLPTLKLYNIIIDTTTRTAFVKNSSDCFNVVSTETSISSDSKPIALQSRRPSFKDPQRVTPQTASQTSTVLDPKPKHADIHRICVADTNPIALQPRRPSYKNSRQDSRQTSQQKCKTDAIAKYPKTSNVKELQRSRASINNFADTNTTLADEIKLKYSLHESQHKNKTVIFVDNPSIIKEVIERAHNESGHPGVNKTLFRLKNSFYFRNMRQRISAVLKNCLHCKLVKSTNQPIFSTLQRLHSPPRPLASLVATNTIVMETTADGINTIADLTNSRKTAVERTEAFQAMKKEKFDKQHHFAEFAVGDKVKRIISR